MKYFLQRLVYTKEGHIDFSWLLVVLFAICGVFGFGAEIFLHVTVSIAAWTWLGTTFSSVLIAAIPIAKARILAASKVPGEVASGIAAVKEELNGK